MRKHHVAIVAACPFSADRGTPIRITGMSETLIARGHRISDVTDHLEMDAPKSGIDVHRTPRFPYRFDGPGHPWTKLLSASGLRLDSSPDPTGLLRILEPLVHGRTKANREHTCRFTRQVLDRLAGRYGLAVLDEAFLDDMDSYHRPRAPRAADGPVRRAAEASVTALNRIICPPVSQPCEISGYVLHLSDVGGVVS